MSAISGRSVSRKSFRAACDLRQQTRTRTSERRCASEKAVDIPARALSRSGSTVGGGFGHPLSPAPRAPVAVLSGCQEEPTPGGWRRQARASCVGSPQITCCLWLGCPILSSSRNSSVRVTSSLVLHHERRPCTFRQRGLVDQGGGDDVFHGVPHRFVDGDLVGRFPAGVASQDHFAQLRADRGIEPLQLRGADRWRRKGVVAFDEQATAFDQRRIELPARRIEPDRGDVRPGRDPLGADRRLLGAGAEADDIGVADGLLAVCRRPARGWRRRPPGPRSPASATRPECRSRRAPAA